VASNAAVSASRNAQDTSAQAPRRDGVVALLDCPVRVQDRWRHARVECRYAMCSAKEIVRQYRPEAMGHDDDALVVGPSYVLIHVNARVAIPGMLIW
jgi:hypothetical protein